ARRLVRVNGRDAEQRPGPFAIAGGDDRRVDVEEALLVEEVVDGLRDAVPQAGNRAEGVGPRPEVGDRAEELEGVALLLERVALGIRIADPFNDGGVNFGRLSLGR